MGKKLTQQQREELRANMQTLIDDGKDENIVSKYRDNYINKYGVDDLPLKKKVDSQLSVLPSKQKVTQPFSPLKSSGEISLTGGVVEAQQKRVKEQEKLRLDNSSADLEAASKEAFDIYKNTPFISPTIKESLGDENAKKIINKKLGLEVDFEKPIDKAKPDLIYALNKNKRESELKTINVQDLISVSQEGLLLEGDNFSQSKTGKVYDYVNKIKSGKNLSQNDFNYLSTYAPNIVKELKEEASKTQKVNDEFPLQGIVEHFNNESISKKVIQSVDENKKALNFASQLGFDLNKYNDNLYLNQVEDKYKEKLNLRLQELEKKYPKKYSQVSTYGGGMGAVPSYSEEKRDDEYYEEKQGILDEYNSIKDNIAKASTAIYVSKNQSASPREIGEFYLSIADKDKYDLFTRGGKLDNKTKGEIEKIGIKSLYGSANKSVAQLAKKDEDELIKKFPELKAEEVYHRLGSELYKKQGGVTLVAKLPTIRELDEIANTQFSEEDKQVYYDYIRPLEQRKVMGTNIPQSGVLNKFGEGFIGGLEETGKFIEDVAGVRGSMEQADEAIKGTPIGRQDVGEYELGKQRLEDLKSKSILNYDEIREKEDLESFVGVRSNFDEVLDMIGVTTGQVAEMAIGGKGVGGVAKGLKIAKTTKGVANATKVGSTLLSYAQSYDGARRDLLSLNPNATENELSAYGTWIGALNAGSELIFNDAKVLDAFGNEVAPLVQRVFQGLSEKELANMTRAELSSSFKKWMLTDGKQFIKEFAKNTGQEVAEEEIVQLGTSIADGIANPAKFSAKEEFDKMVATAYQTAIGGSLVAGVGAYGDVKKNKITIPLLNKVGYDNKLASDVKALILDEQKKGNITEQEANNRIAAISTIQNIHKTTLPSINEIRPLSKKESDKISMITLQERIAKEKIKSGNYNDVKDVLQKQIDNLVDTRNKIINKELVIDDDYNAITIDDYNAKRDAEKNAIEQAKPQNNNESKAQTTPEIPIAESTTDVGQSNDNVGQESATTPTQELTTTEAKVVEPNTKIEDGTTASNVQLDEAKNIQSEIDKLIAERKSEYDNALVGKENLSQTVKDNLNKKISAKYNPQIDALQKRLDEISKNNVEAKVETNPTEKVDENIKPTTEEKTTKEVNGVPIDDKFSPLQLSNELKGRFNLAMANGMTQDEALGMIMDKDSIVYEPASENSPNGIYYRKSEKNPVFGDAKKSKEITKQELLKNNATIEEQQKGNLVANNQSESSQVLKDGDKYTDAKGVERIWGQDINADKTHEIEQMLKATAEGAAMGATIQSVEDFKAGKETIFRKPQSIEAAKNNPNYNVEIQSDGSAKVVGVLDPRNNEWVGVDPKSKTSNKNGSLESLVNQIPTDELRRPNGSIGTQGFTPENLVDVARFIAKEMGFNIPSFNKDLGTSEIKQVIDYLRTNKEAQDKIKEYVVKDPVVVSKLPDDTYSIEDGNHRANLLNLIGVDAIPTIELNGRDKQTAINEHNKAVESLLSKEQTPQSKEKNVLNEKAQAEGADVQKASDTPRQEKSDNHQVYYNGKVVDMGYVPNAKDQFKFAGQRISDNLGTGGFTESVGYIKTPDGKIYEITQSNKSAKLLTGEKLKEAQNKFKINKNEKQDNIQSPTGSGQSNAILESAGNKAESNNEVELNEAIQEADKVILETGIKTATIPISELIVAPKVFQYKASINESGTNANEQIKDSFDPNDAGTIGVWLDVNNELGNGENKVYVVDGHHRTERARLDNVESMNVFFIDAPTAKDAMIIAARTNIKQGKGTSIDAAKVIRENPDAMKGLIAPNSKVAKEGQALSRLNDKLFEEVSTGGLSMKAAIALSNVSLENQDKVRNTVVRYANNPAINQDKVNRYAILHSRQAQLGNATVISQANMFGEDFELDTQAMAEVQSEIVSNLKDDARLLNSASRNASVLENANSQIDTEATANEGQKSKLASALFDKQINEKGTREIFDKAVSDYKNAKNKSEKDAIIKDATQKIKDEIAKQDTTPKFSFKTDDVDIYEEALKHETKEGFINAMQDFRDAHTAPSKDTDSVEVRLEQGGDFSLEEVAKGNHNQPSDYFDNKVGARYYGYDNKEGMQSFTAISNIIRAIKAGAKKLTITAYRAVPKDIDVKELKDYDWVTFSKSYATQHGESRFGEGEYKIITQKVPIVDLWWDGNDINEWGYDTGNTKKYSNRELSNIWDKAQEKIKLSSKEESKESKEYQSAKRAYDNKRKELYGSAVSDNADLFGNVKSQENSLFGSQTEKASEENIQKALAPFKVRLDNAKKALDKANKDSQSQGTLFNAKKGNNTSNKPLGKTLKKLIKRLQKAIKANVFSDQELLKKKLKEYGMDYTKFMAKESQVSYADVINGFYSPLEKVINETKFDKLPAKQWIDKFAKGEEAKWTGLTDWLLQQQGSVSKSDIQQYLKDNRIEIKEVVKGSETYTAEYNENEEIFYIKNKNGEYLKDFHIEQNFTTKHYELYDINNDIITTNNTIDGLIGDFKVNEGNGVSDSNDTKFSQYQLEGEKENYKEVLVTMPVKPISANAAEKRYYDNFIKKGEDKPYEELTQAEKVALSIKVPSFGNSGDAKFKSSHFDEPNILVHLRMNVRRSSDGSKILMLEEIQSDFSAAYRKSQEEVMNFINKNEEDVIELYKKSGKLEVEC